MKKVLIIQNRIPLYRDQLFSEISKQNVDLTICYFEKDNGLTEKNYKTKFFKKIKIASFIMPSLSLINYAKKFDVVIGMFDIKWINICILPFFIKNKFYFWGIGLSSQAGLNINKKYNFLRFSIARRSSGIILYSNYARQIYLKNNFRSNQLFVAHNTVKNDNKIDLSKKKYNNFLFIGSLDERKKIKVLCKAFISCVPYINENIKLIIIGEGKILSDLKKFVSKSGMQKRIIFTGGVYSKREKQKYFANAIAAISYGQAGLSVLESMSYGVPFITQIDAITGGEIYNIKHKKNGYIVNNQKELKNSMIELVDNEKLCKEMSKNSFDYYWNNRTIQQMSNSFLKVIKQ